MHKGKLAVPLDIEIIVQHLKLSLELPLVFGDELDFRKEESRREYQIARCYEKENQSHD